MGYSKAGGKLIHEKNQKQNILWHCAFNGSVIGRYKVCSRNANSQLAD